LEYGRGFFVVLIYIFLGVIYLFHWLTGYPISGFEAAFVLAIIVAMILLYAFLSSKRMKT